MAIKYTKEDLLRVLILLLKDFINKKISGEIFRKDYMEFWKYVRDNKIRFWDTFHIMIDELWSDVDAYEPNLELLKELREKNKHLSKDQIGLIYIDENMLRKKCKIVLKLLKKDIDHSIFSGVWFINK